MTRMFLNFKSHMLLIDYLKALQVGSVKSDWVWLITLSCICTYMYIKHQVFKHNCFTVMLNITAPQFV